jgi:hypothetical protein
VAASALGIAFAATEDISGFTFNIPNGYSEVDDNISHVSPFSIEEKYFKNIWGDTLNITVETCDPGVTITGLEPRPTLRLQRDGRL